MYSETKLWWNTQDQSTSPKTDFILINSKVHWFSTFINLDIIRTNWTNFLWWFLRLSSDYQLLTHLVFLGHSWVQKMPQPFQSMWSICHKHQVCRKQLALNNTINDSLKRQNTKAIYKKGLFLILQNVPV